MDTRMMSSELRSRLKIPIPSEIGVLVCLCLRKKLEREDVLQDKSYSKTIRFKGLLENVILGSVLQSNFAFEREKCCT